MRKLRVVHFGVAHDHSGLTLETVRKFPDLYEVVGVCEPCESDRKRVENQPAYAGLPWMSEEELFALENIDCALVEGDELRALEDAEKCIEKGWHVHMDKPAGTDCARLEKMLQKAKEKGLVFQTGYMYRYNPAMKYILKKVRSGELGDIASIETSMGVRHPAEKRDWLNRFPGGMMFFLGCHLIDMIYQIAGVPEKIIPQMCSTMADGVKAPDNGFAAMVYPHGVATVRVNAAEVNGYNRRHLVVCGTKGTIEVRPLECPTQVKEATLERAKGLDWSDSKFDVFPGYFSGRYDEMMTEFAACVRGDMQNPFDYAYEARLQRLVMAACGADVDFAGPIEL
ncbi:MAG: Gfo/Idh/MocA family oxidoreductase [Clostridia bacterium]|nr:Gfo/Idh/MocA family oxidoreductase [Clostridia bacterium]